MDTKKIANETVQILNNGYYNYAGSQIDINDAIEKSLSGTVVYETFSKEFPNRFNTVVDFRTVSTLDAAKDYENVVALNFASAMNPGGGFLEGAQSQEEFICRHSGLYACLETEFLKKDNVYKKNRNKSHPLYLDFAIYSPEVPVFRNDSADLIPYWLCSFITSPAVNFNKAYRTHAHQVESAMKTRVDLVLSVAAEHGHENVILGAWGCGVFRLDPKMVAMLFKDSIYGKFNGVFKNIIFASINQLQTDTFKDVFRLTN